MSDGLEWHGDELKERLAREAARRLLAAGGTLQTEHMKRLNIANPPPYENSAHKGEYPHKRTGNLQAGVLIDPVDVGTIARTGRLRVGLAQRVAYGADLAERGWKGLLDTLRDLRGKLQQIMGGRS